MSWTADDVLEVQRMERTGLTFSVREGRIWAKPQSLVGIREQAWIAERKPALLELLAVREAWKEISR